MSLAYFSYSSWSSPSSRCFQHFTGRAFRFLVFDLDPLWQSLFLGVFLLVAVSLGSFRLVRIKNKFDIYKGG